jgi:phage tail sheath protein FI
MAVLVSPGVNVSEIDLTTVVPGVSTSTAAFAGVFRWGPVGERVLISNENNLVARFGKPTSLNPETFLTAASYLSYASALYVVRAANTTVAGANAALNSVANTDTANVANCVVKNQADYDARAGFDSGTLYVAKYPGDLGNSLRVSVCDSANAFNSTLDLVGDESSNSITGSFSISIGTNTATLSFKSDDVLAAANTYANTIAAAFSVGDAIKVGNASIGTQYLTISAIGTPSSNATANLASFTLSFLDKYTLATDYVANTTVNGSNTVVGVSRYWEHHGLVSGAPTTSEYVAASGNSSAVDTVHVVVTDQDGKFTGVPGQILEVYQGLSRATDAKNSDGSANYYKSVINTKSAYVWWANDRTGATSATAALVASSSNAKPVRLDFAGGQDGYSEGDVPLGVLASAYDLYKSAEAVDIGLIITGKPVGGSTTVNGQTVSKFQLANYLIDNIATVRKDCIVFASPDDALVTSNVGAEAQSIVNWRGAVTDTTYAVLDSGYKYMYDRYNDVYRYVPLNGDIAGLCARTDQTNDAWWSPAGLTRGQIKNVVKLRFNPNQAERDLLYTNAINPVVSFSGQGTILYGDRTATSKPSAFDRINVRRLFIVLEKAISQVAKTTLFEFNDDFTRTQFRNIVNPYLREVQGRRGITDFLVVCDTTNNTPEVIDRNEFRGDIYVKPVRSINFIQLNFVAVRTGVEFNTIIGRS